MQSNDLLTVAEASQAVRVCPATFYKMLNRQEIQGIKVGRKTFVSRVEIQRYLDDAPIYSARKAA